MPAPIALPPQLGRYRLLDPLGSGGMGAVYLAEDTLLSRKVALKVPHSTPDENPLVAQRFLREARTAAAIEHPNLCPIHDVGEVDGIQFLVMPFIDGSPLSKLIDEEHPWEPTRALMLVKKLASALQVLHERGLIHRDLKPANVMIRPNGEPVIMDFGLAKSVGHESKQLTLLGSLVGTPAYMPPEQVQGDLKALCPATDVYALGVILYELVTGQLPFGGPTEIVLAQILSALPDRPSARRPDLPVWLDTVCLKAMAKKPGERYPSMTLFAHALIPPMPVAPTMYTTVPRAVETLPQAKQVTQTVSPQPKQVAIVARVTCPKCSKSLKVPAEAEGRKVVCPRCQALFLPDQVRRETPSPLAAPDHTIAERPSAKAPWAMWLMACLILIMAALIGWQVIGSKDGDNDKVVKEPEEPSFGGDKDWRKEKPPHSLLEKESTNSLNMKFVCIPAGKFFMGSPNDEMDRSSDEIRHEVEITRPFYLGVHEVTQGQYERVMGKNPSAFPSDVLSREAVVGKDTLRFPMESVSWDDAQEFCEKLSEMEEERKNGRLYRLPTEAEWEYACRGGAAQSLPFGIGDGKSLSSTQVNFDGNIPYGEAAKGDYLKRTCEVGNYKPNAFGLYDMHGNVWEWCQDWYAPYDEMIIKDPTGPKEAKDKRRVLRGGSWNYGGCYCRSAYRVRYDPGYHNDGIGFRAICVVRAP